MAEGQNVCSENKEIRETMRQMRVVNKGIRCLKLQWVIF